MEGVAAVPSQVLQVMQRPYGVVGEDVHGSEVEVED